MKPDPLEGIQSINTGGGALVTGRVDTRGGAFIGRDLIIQQAKPEPPFFWGLPARPAHFVGRETLIADLRQALLEGASVPVVLEGLPGSGKSSLALELANDNTLRDRFPDGVLWGSLGPEPLVSNILAGWMETLGGVTADEQLSDPERAQAVRDLIGDHAILLVIDDAWRKEDAERLRCAGRNSRILLTTRDKALALGFTRPDRIHTIPELDPNGAETLLNQLAPQALEADPDRARALIQAVGGLPLGLMVLGGYLQGSTDSFFPELSQPALADLEDPALRLAQAVDRISGPGQGAEPLREILALSLEVLPPEAIRAFHALGAFAPKPAVFSREAAEGVTAASLQTLGLLGMRNLIERLDDGALTIHQVLSDLARTAPDPEAVRRHREYYLGQVQADVQDWERIEPLYDQIQAAWRANPDDASLIPFIEALQTYHQRRGLWQEELAWLTRALAMAEAENLATETAALHFTLGQIQNRLGRPDLALDHLNRARAILEAAGDIERLILVEQMLGIIYLGTERSEKAFEHLERSGHLAETAGNQHRATEAQLLAAHANRRLGRHQQALDLIRQVLAQERAQGNRVGEADALSIMSMALVGLGRREEAFEHLREAAAIWQSLNYTSSMADLYNGMAKFYQDSGEYEAALQVLQSAFEAWESIGDRGGYAESLARMGDIQQKMGDHPTALKTYKEVLQIQQEMGIEPQIAEAYQDVGIAWHRVGNMAASAEAHHAAFQIWERLDRWDRLADGYLLLGGHYALNGDPAGELPYAQQGLAIRMVQGDPGEIAFALAQVGRCYLNLGRPDLAAPLFEKELGRRRELEQPAATAHYFAGLAYEALDQLSAAQLHWQAALAIWTGEADRPDRSLALQKLARGFARQGDHRQAVETYRELLPLREALEDWGGLAFSQYYLSLSLAWLDEIDEALAHLDRALDFWIKQDEHAMEAVARNRLGRLLQSQGKPDAALDQFTQALTYYQVQGDPANQAALHWNLADLHGEAGAVEAAMDHLAARAALLAGLDDLSGQADSLTAIGAHLEGLARYEEAADRYRQAAEVLDDTDHQAQLAEVVHKLGSALYMAKRPDEALAAWHQALERQEVIGEAVGHAHTLLAMGIALKSTGRLEEAAARFQEAAPLFEAAGDPFWLGTTWAWLALNQSELGRLGESVTYLEQARALYQDLDHPAWLANVLVNLATAHDRLGDQAQARSNAEQAAALLEATRPETLKASHHYDIGQVSLLQEQYDRALAHFSQAMTLFEAAGEVESVAITRRRMGMAYHRQGRLAEAHAQFEQAIALERQHGFPWLEAQARLNLAQVLRDLGQAAAARSEVAQILALVQDPEDLTVREAQALLQALEAP